MKTIFIISVLVAVVSAEFPPFVEICKRDPHLNDCLKNNMNMARDYLKHGEPSLCIPPKSDEIVIDKYTVTPLKTMNTMHEQGFTYSHLDSYDVKNVNLDLDNDRISIDWIWKRILVKGNYKFEGTLLGYTVNGGGLCNADLANVGISLTMTGNRKQKEDKNYIIFNNVDLKLELSQLKGFVSFAHIFPSDEKTSFLNKTLNNNLQDTLYIFEPVIKDVVVQPFVNIIEKLFQTHPIEVLIP